MFRVAKFLEVKSELTTQQKTWQTLREGSCNRTSKNYLFFRRHFQLLFFVILEKYPESELACRTIGKNSTPYDQRIAVSGRTNPWRMRNSPMERVAGGDEYK